MTTTARPPARSNGQWAVDGREPLNPNEVFKAADDEVAHIIAANLGRSGKSAVAVASPKVGSQQAVQAVQAQKHASAPVQPAVQAPVVQ